MEQTNTNPGFLATLFGGAIQNVSSQLPSKQQVIIGYLGAVVAFWVVGGITLAIVNSLTDH